MAYSEEQVKEKFETIIRFISDYGYSLRKACKDAAVPPKTFYEWISGDEEKSKQYARACEERADAIADEIIDIADETSKDLIIDIETGTEVVNHEVIQRSKLRVDTRKWLLGKLAPKKYGDKVDITTGGDKITSGHKVIFEIIDGSKDTAT